MSVIIDGTNGIDKIAAGAIEKADLPSGNVLQVVQTVKTDTTSSTSTSYVTILSASITPTSSSSKFLLLGQISYSGYNATPFFKFQRNGTDLLIGDSAGSRGRVHIGSHLSSSGTLTFVQYLINNAQMTYLDSPSTSSAITYTVQYSENNGSGQPSYINRSVTSTDASWEPRTASSLIVMEIAG